MKTQLRSLIVLMLCFMAAGDGRAQVITPVLSRSFNNPTPEALVEHFGWAVTTLGESRVLIGAYQDNNGGTVAGAAYLFGTDGTLLTTITNPVPAGGNFAYSLATVGGDKLLIGRLGTTGFAYLYTTNAALITTFTNPIPAEQQGFGYSVAALSAELVAVSAVGSGSPITPQTGAVFLFATNGTLVTTITNPNPDAFIDSFGSAIKASGTDKLLVGARGTTVNGNRSVGVVYLFGTNGMLVSTFTNPAPAAFDLFGRTVTMVGSQRVLIGAEDSGAVGSAYLFNTNGALLTTFSNPDPAANELFGSAIATLGEDLIIIGAPQDTPGFLGQSHTGSVYVFNTNGTLLRTIANLVSPWPDDHFGNALAVIGTNQILIGAEQKVASGFAPGAAYLFSLSFLPPPALGAERVDGGSTRVFWPRPSTGFVLEQNATLATNSWTRVPFPYQTNVTQISVTVSSATNQFFRLRQP